MIISETRKQHRKAKGESMYKYCVAQVRVNSITNQANVSYYAYEEGSSYGLHTVNDVKDDNVLWHDTAEEAAQHILNEYGECVLCFCTDYIPKFHNN